MSKPKGLWITVGGGSLAEAVTRSIESHGEFTTTVAIADVRPRFAELAIISLNDSSINYVGISQAGRRVVTGQRTITISNLVAVAQLTTNEIRARLPKRFRRGFRPPPNGAYRPTPRLWEEMFKIVATRLPAEGKGLKDLNRIIAGAVRPRWRVSGGLEVFERDAVASALQVWGGTSTRKRILREALPQQTPLASFLSQLQSVSVREDVQISHDHTTFPGMEVARRDLVGSVILTNGQDYLTILNCNRQPLEQTLGVDLIYYNHHFDSFVLVQYKRMADGERGAEYRPHNDQNHEKEMQRMIETENKLRGLQRPYQLDINTFRLSGRPFFIKLCESKAKSALDAGMVSGMYVPLELWLRLLRSPIVRGQKGGVVITWENCRRRLNNSEFTNLLRNGWIGSADGDSKYLAEIIEAVLGSGRMLVMAATSEGTLSKDFRRDTLGRFTAEDDPAGAI